MNDKLNRLKIEFEIPYKGDMLPKEVVDQLERISTLKWNPSFATVKGWLT